MKKILFTIVLLATVCTAYAQGIMSKWPQLKSFHTVMSQTFHPSEEGNLTPIKERSTELAMKADSLSSSNIPAEYNTSKIQKAVLQLKVDAKKLDELIKSNKATDAHITKALSDLHDVFHQIVGLCKNEQEH